MLKSLLKRESWTPYCFIVLFVFFSSGVFFSATLISLGTNQLGCTGLGTKDRSDKWCSIILKCWEYHLVVLYILSEPEVEAPGWPSSSAEAPCARGKLPETRKWESGQLRNSMEKWPEDELRVKLKLKIKLLKERSNGRKEAWVLLFSIKRCYRTHVWYWLTD